MAQMNGLLRSDELCGLREGGSRIWISRETRKIAAGNVYPQAVAGSESIAGGPEVKLEAVALTGLHQLRRLITLSESCSKTPVHKVESPAVGFNNDELGHEVRIYGGAFDKQDRSYGPGNL